MNNVATPKHIFAQLKMVNVIGEIEFDSRDLRLRNCIAYKTNIYMSIRTVHDYDVRLNPINLHLITHTSTILMPINYLHLLHEIVRM